MNGILTLAGKDLRLLWRDRLGMFWVVLFPLLMALFFGSMFSGEGSGTAVMKIALVGDKSPSSESFFKKLNSSVAA
jgi:ABC-2 type transport system permease protein